MIPGDATPTGTAAYASRYAARQWPAFYRDAQGLTVSSLGIGTYLGGMDEATDRGYEEAVSTAIGSGINFIDTSLNYRNQRSERSIGAALKRASCPREELVVCTKAGYLIRGAVPDLKPDDIAGGNHSIAPDFLRDQLERSRSNLGCATVDVLYLHNPETQLAHVTRDEFDRRTLAAFRALEQLRAKGMIRFYGVATWDGFRKPGLLSLSRMLEMATEAGGEQHGFRFVQLPLNLAMREGFANGITAQAHQAGITVVTSASISQSRLASGLRDALKSLLVPGGTDAQSAIQFARSTPGVTVSLVGMSRKEHVEQNIGVARVAPIAHDDYARLVERL